MNDTLHQVLVHAHSVGRWLLLLLLLFAIFNSLIAGDRPFIGTDRRLGSILTGIADLMLLLGLALWFFGPWGYQLIKSSGSLNAAIQNPVEKFFVFEHLPGMLIAVILIHIGKAQGKKSIADKKKHTRTLVFYLLALIIILGVVPWPFRDIFKGVTNWY